MGKEEGNCSGFFAGSLDSSLFSDLSCGFLPGVCFFTLDDHFVITLLEARGKRHRLIPKARIVIKKVVESRGSACILDSSVARLSLEQHSGNTEHYKN